MLDDFGTGYSSLAYLKRFPLDVLKIDRSFVAGLGRDEDDAAIVAAIVQMARTLGLTVVAEGVERPEQLERLRELGCDRAQGRLIAEPMPAGEIERLMASAARRRDVRVFDGHNDVLSRVLAAGPGAPEGFLAGDGAGHLDLPRAARGGLAGGCFAVFTCRAAARRLRRSAPTSQPVPHERALREALAQVALLLRLERDSGGRLRIARGAGGPRRRRAGGRAPPRGRRADRHRRSTSSRSCTPPGCARSGSCGAAATRSRPASRSASPARPTRARA